MPYIDKRGVINGLRAPILALPQNQFVEDTMCSKPCKFAPPHCLFMETYKKYLNSLDFNDIYSRAVNLAERAAERIGVKNPDVVFMVHEPKTCLCAERPVLQEWFKEHNIEISEWERGIV